MFSKGILGMFLVLVMTVFGLAQISGYGAEEIRRVQLTIRSAPDEESGYQCTVGTKASYEVDEVNLISGFDLDSPGPGTEGLSFAEIERCMKENSEKVLEIVLWAKDGYNFGTLREKDIVLKGLGGRCLKATRREGRAELVLEVAVNEAKRHRKISDADWQGNSTGLGVWTEADRDSVYRVFLYQDDKMVGTKHSTSGTQFDFTALIKEPGFYRFLVQSLDENEIVQSSCKSSYMFFNGFTGGTAANPADDGMESPAVNSSEMDAEGLCLEADGVPVQNNWFYDEEAKNWYFCDAGGKRMRDTWFLWKGKPYQVDADGVWIQQMS